MTLPVVTRMLPLRMTEEISIHSFLLAPGDIPVLVNILHLICENTKNKYA